MSTKGAGDTCGQGPAPAGAAKILLAGLRRRGFRLDLSARGPSSRDGWALGVEPASALTDADRAAVTLHREALLDLLHAEDDGSPCTPFRWHDDAPPGREEWDEGAQQWVTVPGRRPFSAGVCPVPRLPDLPPAVGPAVPPPGARLHYQTRGGRACGPRGRKLSKRQRHPVHLWTWEGAPRWYRAAEHPPPHGLADETAEV